MNIFVLDEDPRVSAQMMIDKHVVKMPTESLQMMSANMVELDVEAPYKQVMLNHPCTIWARKSRQNFQWLREHAQALCDEYSLRYENRIHSVDTTMQDFSHRFDEMERKLPDFGLTTFAIAMADEYRSKKIESETDLDFVIRSYQNYYLNGKWDFATWKTKKPDWWPDNHIAMKQAERDEFVERIRRKLYGEL